MRALKYIGIGVAVIVAGTIATAIYLLGGNAVPQSSSYAIDLARLRTLAAAMEGPLPTAIDSELVAVGSMPRAFLMAGESFEPQDMVHPVFRILYPDGRFILIDTALDAATAEEMGADSFDPDAYSKLVDAMSSAWQIVLTHEHQDHIGGAARHPDPDRLAERLKLTREQYDNAGWLEAAGFPESLRERLEPLDYEGATAIAPGVVLQKAPGHTLGSQMVFVTLAGGRELLFVGDVAWCREALQDLKYRPRVTTLILGEQRELVLEQFRALHDLLSNGRVQIVISHERGDREAAGIGLSFGG